MQHLTIFAMSNIKCNHKIYLGLLSYGGGVVVWWWCVQGAVLTAKITCDILQKELENVTWGHDKKM
jgi:hypothetical protein